MELIINLAFDTVHC